MADAVARAQYVRMSPRKLRLVADLIRGKKVSEAQALLRFTVKAAAPILGKLLASAVANAVNAAAEKRQRIDTDEMVVTRVLVDGAATWPRMGVAPRGRRVRIRKRTSHIELAIGDM